MIKTTFLLLVLISCVFAHLTTTISTERDTVHLGFEKIKINWSISNDDSFPVLMLKFGTPLEGTFQNTLTTDMFEIYNDNGVTPIYTGILVKRAEPVIEDYQILKAGSAISGQIILTDAYHFTVDGTYTIKLSTFHSNLLSLEPLESNEVTITVKGAKPFEYVPFEESVDQAVKFTSCSSSQQSTLNTAINSAITASNAALSYLNNGCRTSYTTWYGTYSSSNYNTVKSSFSSIYSNLNGKNFGLNCACNQAGTYAYVYPSDASKTIHVCSPVFWNAPSSAYSWNSKPGTLTHEMSHFTAVAGTSDYQYGVTGCKNLAQTNPSRAIKNADNYEYFQESNPSSGAC